MIKDNTWIDATLTRQFTRDAIPRVDFVVMEPPQGESKCNQITHLKKKQRKNNRPKTSLSSSKGTSETLRTFKVRLKPTKEQKLFFQKCFSVAVLAKQLAYKHLGDQTIRMTGKIMKALKKKICTVRIQERKYKEEVKDTAASSKGKKKQVNDDSNNKTNKAVGYRNHKYEILSKMINATVNPFLRKRLYNPKVHSDVRANAVISFCCAISAMQAFMEERQKE